MPEHDKPQRTGPTMSETVDIMGIVSNAFIACIQPFIRKHNGKESPGVYAIAALVILLCTAKDRATVLYFFAWLVMLIYRRITTFTTKEVIHTRYMGDPVFCIWRGDRREYAQEFVVCLIASFGIYAVSKPLGTVWLIATGGLLYVEMVMRLLIQKRKDALNDARIEMSFEADLARESRGM